MTWAPRTDQPLLDTSCALPWGLPAPARERPRSASSGICWPDWSAKGSRNRLCVSGERALRPDDVMVIEGVVTTSPLRTALDPGRLAHRNLAIGALDALLRHGEFSSEELLDGVARFRGQRGVVQLRPETPQDPGRAP